MPNTQTEKICPECHNPLEPEWVRCPFCEYQANLPHERFTLFRKIDYDDTRGRHQLMSELGCFLLIEIPFLLIVGSALYALNQFLAH